MRTLPLAVLFALGIAPPGFADPIAPCEWGTLDHYLQLGSSGCTVGNVVFSNFSASTPLLGSRPIGAGEVGVNPVDRPGRPGLGFDLEQSATTGELFQILVGYTVSGGAVAGITTSMIGSSAGRDGVVSVLQDTCLGGSFTASDPAACVATFADSIALFDAGIDVNLVQQLAFAPAGVVGVLTDIAIDGGLFGSASLAGTVTSQFVQVPEPSTLLLFSAGVGALVARGRPAGHPREAKEASGT